MHYIFYTLDSVYTYIPYHVYNKLDAHIKEYDRKERAVSEIEVESN